MSREFIAYRTVSGHRTGPRHNWSLKESKNGLLPAHSSPWLVQESIHLIEYSAYKDLKDEFKDFFMDFLNQGCGEWNEEKGYHEYDHMCLSTYEGGVERALEMDWIKKEQVLR